MRYLRMLSNSVAVGALAAAYVVLLFLHLNPTLPADAPMLAALASTVGLFYAVHLAAIAYGVLVLRQMLGRDVFSPAWISIGVIGCLAAVAAGTGAAIMWANVRTFAIVLEPETARTMTRSAVLLAGAAVLFGVVAIIRRYGSRRAWAAALVAIAVGSIAGPLWLRGRGRVEPLDSRTLSTAIDVPRPERAARVTVIGIDAASLELITSVTSEGRLPNFGRILDDGAVMHLATLHPTSAEAVWAAIASGKLPQKNGVRSAGVYRLSGENDRAAIQLLPDFCFAEGLMRFGFLAEELRTAASLRARPLWAILSMAGVGVGVVNWPLTYPAPPVRGFVVSDAYARLALTPSALDKQDVVYPPELYAEALAVAPPSDEAPFVPAVVSGIAGRHQAPARTDHLYDRLYRSFSAVHPFDVGLMRFQSLDPIGHYFLRYAMPSRFGDVSEEERRKYGPVLEAHYAMVDEAIGRAIAALGPDDLLLVVSGFGIEPLGFGKRLLEQAIGDPEISGTHEGAPDGFLMAYGASVAKGRQIRRASVVDVVPTILYFLGLPVGRDMDGYARTDLFQPAFTDERPITFIPTYDR